MTPRIFCPRCRQGWIARVQLGQTDERAWVCDECEGVWWWDINPIPDGDLNTELERLDLPITRESIPPSDEVLAVPGQAK